MIPTPIGPPRDGTPGTPAMGFLTDLHTPSEPARESLGMDQAAPGAGPSLLRRFPRAQTSNRPHLARPRPASRRPLAVLRATTQELKGRNVRPTCPPTLARINQSAQQSPRGALAARSLFRFPRLAQDWSQGETNQVRKRPPTWRTMPAGRRPPRRVVKGGQ